jgi:tRNA pseudouridine55 synthase
VATPTYDAASLRDGVRRSIDDGRWALSDGQSVTDGRWPTDGELEAVLQKFRGSFLQVPPPYSAKKIASVPAYEKARKNQQVELKPVSVTVRTLEVLHSSGLDVRPSAIDHRSSVIDDGLLRLRVVASAGFYVRSLAHDIGEALGCGAHLEALRRTQVGRFRVDDALTLDRVESEGGARLTPASDLLGHMTAVTVTEQGVRRIAHGNAVTPSLTADGVRPLFPLTVGDVGFCRVLDGSGRLLAVAEPRPGGVLQPVVVLR